MSDKEKSIDFCLDEIKEQYRIFLEGFDDIKKKSEILLVVCSLIITLPLSNDFIIKNIKFSIYSLSLFIAGIIFLIMALFLLIISLKDTPIAIPYFEDIFLSIKKYKSIDVKTAVIKSYKRDLERNLSQIEKKRESVRNAETFIKIGIILVVGNLLFVIMI